MKKYKVWGQIGTHSFDYTIEADHFTYSQAGVYRFMNSETNQEWFYPINRTVVKTIIE
jgi:hypothetical protein